MVRKFSTGCTKLYSYVNKAVKITAFLVKIVKDCLHILEADLREPQPTRVSSTNLNNFVH